MEEEERSKAMSNVSKLYKIVYIAIDKKKDIMLNKIMIMKAESVNSCKRKFKMYMEEREQVRSYSSYYIFNIKELKEEDGIYFQKYNILLDTSY